MTWNPGGVELMIYQPLGVLSAERPRGKLAGRIMKDLRWP